MATQQQGTDITSLSVQQLQALSKQCKEEITQLTQNSAQLELAHNKYNESKKAVEFLKNTNDGDEVMVPLTTSMYVPGRVKTPEKVIVELGSGFSVKKTVDEAVEFFQRKMGYLEKNVEQIEKHIMRSRNNLESIHAMLNLRIRQQTEQPPQAQASN